MQKKILSDRPFRRVAGPIPKAVIQFFEGKLKFAGNREDTRVWLGKRLLISVCMGLILLLLYLIIFNPMYTPVTFSLAIAIFLFGFALSTGLYYLKLYFDISERTTKVEKVLPDFLLLTVSNLRAGMAPFAAFVHAARPQFGDLHEEVKLSTAKAGGTASLVDALNEVSNYFDSKILRRTVSLFAKGTRSGGQLTQLLTASADEVRRIQDLRAELISSTRTYTIFLGFILVIIMPFLLSVSTQFLTIFLLLESETPELEGLENIPQFSGNVLINPDQLITIALLTLLLTSFLVSGLAGIIARGKALYGIKYFPFFAIGSIVMFFVATMMMESMFSAFAFT